MGNLKQTWRRFRGRVIGGLAFPLLFPLSPAAGGELLPELAAQAAPLAAAPAAQAETGPLSLSDAIRMALDKQPALAAYRASLAGAETGRRAAEAIKVPTFLARDLPYRRKQAAIGVGIAAAGVQQAEQETVYAVTRLYYTVVYARAQKKVADEVVAHMKATRDTAEQLLKGGSRDVTTSTVDKIDVYMGLAQTRQADAAQGIERALAALREAIGLGPDCPIVIAEQDLPTPSVSVELCDVISMALARRPELVQATGFAEVTNLEIDAQGTKLIRPIVPTFANASDIHARPVPQGIANGEYRPGAVGPEMPNVMVGHRSYRVEHTRDLYARALAVVDKARGLIALEAEDAYLRWRQAATKVAQSRDAARKGSKLSEDTRRDFGADQKVKAEDVLTNEVLASQAQAQYNEARYNLILALAALERVTAGGFCAGLAGPAPAPAAEPANGNPPAQP